MATRILNAVLVPALVLNVTAAASAQSQGPAVRTGRAAALNDLTGYWVSIVNEDWRLRMIVPDPRDYLTLPLTAAASKVADAWDPAADKAAGNECKSYGAAAIMRVPGRCTSTGRMTTRCESMPIPEPRPVRFTSAARRHEGRLLPGKATRSPLGWDRSRFPRLEIGRASCRERV